MMAKKIRVKEIERLGRLKCTQTEAARALNISSKQFKEILQSDRRARDAWEGGQMNGNISLRRKQMRLASTSAPMAIFLGKQFLGQKDVVVSEHSGPGGGPIASLNLGDLSETERKKLRSLLTRSS